MKKTSLKSKHSKRPPRKTHLPPGACADAGRKSAAVTDPEVILPSEICAAPRKPRWDAPLQNLPRKMQDEMIRRVEETTYVDTAKWLEGKGIKVLDITVKRFRKWYYERLRREAGEAMAWDEIRRAMKENPNMSENELAAHGRKAFASLAIETKDAVNWARQQMVRQREMKIGIEKKRVALLEERNVHFEEQLKLAREKFEFDAAKAAQKVLPTLNEIEGNPDLDDDEKIRRIRIALFGEAPE